MNIKLLKFYKILVDFSKHWVYNNKCEINQKTKNTQTKLKSLNK